jgi:hypothetical protein
MDLGTGLIAQRSGPATQASLMTGGVGDREVPVDEHDPLSFAERRKGGTKAFGGFDRQDEIEAALSSAPAPCAGTEIKWTISPSLFEAALCTLTLIRPSSPSGPAPNRAEAEA